MRFITVLSLCVMLCFLIDVGHATDETPVQSPANGELANQTQNLIKEWNLNPLIESGLAFLSQASQGNLQKADSIFAINDHLRDTMNNGKIGALLRKAELRPPEFSATFVGFNMITGGVSTLVYVVPTIDGPIAFKLYVYRYKTGNHLGRIDATADWTEIENMLTTVQRLPLPLEINAKSTEPATVPTGGF